MCRGWTSDISAGGLFVICPDRPPWPGGEVHIEIKLPCRMRSDHQLVLRGTGTVVRVGQNGMVGFALSSCSPWTICRPKGQLADKCV